MSFARKRECNVVAAAGFLCAKAKRQQQQHDAGHEGLSQDVMVLAFVPLSLIPKESPSRNEDQLILWYMF